MPTSRYYESHIQRRKKLERKLLLKKWRARCQWLTPVTLVIQEAEIRRIAVRSQSGQIVHDTLSQNTIHKNRAGGVAQGEGPEFKPHYRKKRKKERKK
jgi:hypothetical protein